MSRPGLPSGCAGDYSSYQCDCDLFFSLCSAKFFGFVFVELIFTVSRRTLVLALTRARFGGWGRGGLGWGGGWGTGVAFEE